MDFQFGAFVLAVEARRLLRKGHDVHVTPKAFELLKALVENYPRALSRAELHDRLWHGVFVSEGNLALLMTEIRTALGDDAREPRYIRTLHGFGYAFKAEVVEVKPQVPAADEQPRAVGGDDVGQTHWLIWESRSFRLVSGENVIGRNPDSQVVLDVPGVSRRHACVTIGESSSIRDLDSKNGTTVRGQRVASTTEIHDKDQVEIGPVTLTYREVLAVGGAETFTMMREPSSESRRR